MNNIQLRLLYYILITLQTATQLILSIPQTAPSFVNHEELQVMNFLLSVVMQLLLLMSSILPANHINLTLRQRLFPNFHGHHFRGRDVFSMMFRQRYLFWLNTGETPESFLNIVHHVAPHMSLLTREGRLRRRMGKYKLNIINRVLLVFVWVRKYPHLDTLALLFDVSPQTVLALLYQGILVLWRYFQGEVKWPSVREWNGMRNTWREFPNALGCIDVTPHEICIPSNEPQRRFYSGHRHYHALNTQLVCDNEGHIRFVQAGFLGSTHDAQSFRLMEPIGPGLNLDFPLNAVLLADKGYPEIDPLLTPFRQIQIRRLGPRDRRRAQRFNRELSRKRIKVEHIFKFLKDYKCVTGIWRGGRWLLPIVIELCVLLTERHISLFQEV